MQHPERLQGGAVQVPFRNTRMTSADVFLLGAVADTWDTLGSKFGMAASLLQQYAPEELCPFLFRRGEVQRACRVVVMGGTGSPNQQQEVGSSLAAAGHWQATTNPVPGPVGHRKATIHEHDLGRLARLPS